MLSLSNDAIWGRNHDRCRDRGGSSRQSRGENSQKTANAMIVRVIERTIWLRNYHGLTIYRYSRISYATYALNRRQQLLRPWREADNGVIINIHGRVGRYDEDHDARSCTIVIKGEYISNEGRPRTLQTGICKFLPWPMQRQARRSDDIRRCIFNQFALCDCHKY